MHPRQATTAPSPTGLRRPLSLVVVILVTAAVAGVVGLGVGGLGSFLLFSDGGRGEGDSRAEQNLATGCEILERISDDLPLEEDDVSLDEPLLHELIGAGSIFMAAGVEDERYQWAWDAGHELQTGATRIDLEGMSETAEQLLERCEEL